MELELLLDDSEDSLDSPLLSDEVDDSDVLDDSEVELLSEDVDSEDVELLLEPPDSVVDSLPLSEADSELDSETDSLVGAELVPVYCVGSIINEQLAIMNNKAVGKIMFLIFINKCPLFRSSIISHLLLSNLV